jgi:hypothetical protein
MMTMHGGVMRRWSEVVAIPGRGRAEQLSHRSNLWVRRVSSGREHGNQAEQARVPHKEPGTLGMRNWRRSILIKIRARMTRTMFTTLRLWDGCMRERSPPCFQGGIGCYVAVQSSPEPPFLHVCVKCLVCGRRVNEEADKLVNRYRASPERPGSFLIDGSHRNLDKSGK